MEQLAPPAGTAGHYRAEWIYPSCGIHKEVTATTGGVHCGVCTLQLYSTSSNRNNPLYLLIYMANG